MSRRQGEDQKKLDIVANEVFINVLRRSGQCSVLVGPLSFCALYSTQLSRWLCLSSPVATCGELSRARASSRYNLGAWLLANTGVRGGR